MSKARTFFNPRPGRCILKSLPKGLIIRCSLLSSGPLILL